MGRGEGIREQGSQVGVHRDVEGSEGQLRVLLQLGPVLGSFSFFRVEECFQFHPLFQVKGYWAEEGALAGEHLFQLVEYKSYCVCLLFAGVELDALTLVSHLLQQIQITSIFYHRPRHVQPRQLRLLPNLTLLQAVFCH